MRASPHFALAGPRGKLGDETFCELELAQDADEAAPFVYDDVGMLIPQITGTTRIPPSPMLT